MDFASAGGFISVLIYLYMIDLDICQYLQIKQMIPVQKHSLNFKQQTEKALRTINEHEKIKRMRFTTMLNIKSESGLGHTTGATKIFQPREKVKLQLLPQSLAYYRMELNSKIDPKIIIRHFRGGPTDIFIFFDKMAKELEKAQYHFVIKDEIILKFSSRYKEEAKHIILVFRNLTALTHLQFRIDCLREKKKPMEVKTDKSIASVELQEITIDEIKLKRSRSSKAKLHKLVSSQELISAKPEFKLKRIFQLKSISLEKKEAAIKRVQNIQINKEKSAEALKVVASCKKMFNTYRDLVSEENEKKLAILKQNTPLLLAIKYCFLSSMFFNEREKNTKREITIRSYQKKFIKKIRRAYRLTKAMQPDQSVRELEAFTQVSSLIGHAVYKVDVKRSAGIVWEAFNNCFPGFLINLAMNESSNYRRVVRSVQRKWKSRFEARNTMLLIYAEEQLKVILKAYPQLQYVQKEYRQGNKAYKICLEYQKETASKMKDLISAYHHRLEEIKEYQQINQEIKIHNETALKKKQKELLEIPKKPSYPQFRFFRDLLFMKSMVRGELEVLFRKYKKRNPQLFVEAAVDSSKKSPRKGK